MKIPILMYHQIDATPPRGSRMRGLVVHPRSFAWQMGMLQLLGFRGLSMRDLEPYLAGEKAGRVVGLTFDDGYQNNLRHALPVLRRHGFTATCYGVSGLLGGSNVWDHGEGIAQKPLMTRAEWQHWVGQGMDVGSHTCNHVDLTAVPPELAAQEIRDAKTALEAALDTEVRHFCYPYGRYSAAQTVADGGGLEDEGEDSEVMEVTIDDALAMIMDGRIQDGKTIMLLQHAALYLFKHR